MKIRCFIDTDARIWSVDKDGHSNHPADVIVLGDTIQILGSKDCLGPGREISEEYTLHPSLTALAEAVENLKQAKSLQDVIRDIPKLTQHQGSTQEQLKSLWSIANSCGLHDAADAIRTMAGVPR